MSEEWINKLFYGDNLNILSDREKIYTESVDLIYLDPPFNSKAPYNILFKEPTGELSEAQITAFEDTWHWTEETEKTFQRIIDKGSANVIKMISALVEFVGRNDVTAYLTMMCIRLLELKRVLKKTGTIYLHCDPTASHYLKILMDTIFGKYNFRNEIIWGYSGGGIAKKDFPRKHDVILRYSKTNNYFYEPIYKHYTKGTIERGRTAVKGGVKLSKKGTPIPDWWFSNLECDHCNKKLTANLKRIASPDDPEKLGYPTQKSMELLSRIINSSSRKNDVVLDPFCGCGTTVAAAQALKRKWIGIDITFLAVDLIIKRLSAVFHLISEKDYKIIGEPEDLAGAIELANQNKYQFQWWAISKIDNAKAYGDKKKGADTGIDGYLFFTEGRQVNTIIIQVKGGKIAIRDIRELGHVIDRENAKIGIFVTLKKPTSKMKTEAAAKGYYELDYKKYPKLQILTIEEILSGKKPNIPLAIPSHKKAKSQPIEGDSSPKDQQLLF